MKRQCVSSLPAWFTASALMLVAGDALAQIATLVATQDATLIEDTAGGLANGAGANLFAGRVNAVGDNRLRRALLRFDLSALPPQAQIQSASVRLVLTRSRIAGNLPVTLHRVSTAWTEGPSVTSLGTGVPSVDGDVTWIHRSKPSLLWSQPGGDFTPAPSASRLVPAALGPYVWSSTAALVADAQQWLNTPASNHGWIVLGLEDGTISAKSFAAREIATPASRPTLVVEYTVPVADNDVPLPAWAIASLALALAAAVGARRRS